MDHVTITIDFDVKKGHVTKGFITGAIKREFLPMLCLEKAKKEAMNLKVKTTYQTK